MRKGGHFQLREKIFRLSFGGSVRFACAIRPSKYLCSFNFWWSTMFDLKFCKLYWACSYWCNCHFHLLCRYLLSNFGQIWLTALIEELSRAFAYDDSKWKRSSKLIAYAYRQNVKGNQNLMSGNPIKGNRNRQKLPIQSCEWIAMKSITTN